MQRAADGRVLLGTNIETGEKTYISMSDTCTIEPVTDDMAICQPGFQSKSGKLALFDGEDGWFIRVDGITEYGSDPLYERISIHTKEPLMFFNIEGVPRATCLLWEHTLDSDGTPCPNPRVTFPAAPSSTRKQAGRGGCAELWCPHAPRHGRASQLRHHGADAYHPAGSGLDVASGGAPRFQ